MRRSWGGWEVWVRCCLTGSGVGEMGRSRPCCYPDTINSVLQLLGWGGNAKIFWTNQNNLECHRKLLSAQGFDIQVVLSLKPLPAVTSCFWKCGWAHFCSSAGVIPSDCLVTKNKNCAVGIEFIGHYLPDPQLFRKTRNESIKGLFLSNRHGRGEGCGCAKREAALPAQWELELAFRSGHGESLTERGLCRLGKNFHVLHWLLICYLMIDDPRDQMRDCPFPAEHLCT